jgi:lipoprotein NlpD
MDKIILFAKYKQPIMFPGQSGLLSTLKNISHPILQLLLSTLLALTLVACSVSGNHNASSTYRVTPGETLYSIAWRFGLDYRQLAANNHLAPPYHLKAGQVISVSPEDNDETTTISSSSYDVAPSDNQPIVSGENIPANAPKLVNTANIKPGNHFAENHSFVARTSDISPPNPKMASAIAPVMTNYSGGAVQGWVWPVRGRIIHSFSGGSEFNKGIDIAGNMGQPVLATAAGRVVYCGNGLHGYGQLIIIKHNDVYLSAYAHNSKLLVHEGQLVRSGQEIALMGDTEAQQVMLHFEIRRAGKPVDPLIYLGRSYG